MSDDVGGIAADQLRSLIARIERLEEEKAALDKSAQDVKKTCDEIDNILAE